MNKQTTMDDELAIVKKWLQGQFVRVQAEVDVPEGSGVRRVSLYPNMILRVIGKLETRITYLERCLAASWAYGDPDGLAEGDPETFREVRNEVDRIEKRSGGAGRSPRRGMT